MPVGAVRGPEKASYLRPCWRARFIPNGWGLGATADWLGPVVGALLALLVPNGYHGWSFATLPLPPCWVGWHRDVLPGVPTGYHTRSFGALAFSPCWVEALFTGVPFG